MRSNMTNLITVFPMLGSCQLCKVMLSQNDRFLFPFFTHFCLLALPYCYPLCLFPSLKCFIWGCSSSSIAFTSFLHMFFNSSNVPLSFLFSPPSLQLFAAAEVPPGGGEADPLLERQAYLDGEDGAGTGQSATHLCHSHIHSSHYLPVLQASAQGALSPGHAVQRYSRKTPEELKDIVVCFRTFW